MAVPFIYLLLFFAFSLPCFSFKCPNQVKYGGFDINYPFFTNTTPECGGKYLVVCNGSVPMLQFEGASYAVMNISYPSKVITIKDEALSQYFARSNCNFLFNFTAPIHHFNLFNLSNGFSTHVSTNSINCSMVDTDLFKGFFRVSYNSNLCGDYNFCHSDKDRSLVDLPPNCSSAKPTLFEWIFSFNEHDESFSLLSAGFSRQVKLQEDCFRNGGGVSSCKCDHSCKNKGSRSRKKTIGIGSVVVAGLLLICLSLALYFYGRRKASNSIIFCKNNLNKNNNVEAFLEEYGSLAPRRYSYSSVKKITKAFQEKLGQGGFSTVFKGTLSNGHVVAVKILNDSKGDGEDFISEVASIGRTSHVNVVSLLGFCCEGSKRALIYDFMCNGSLEKLLYFEQPKKTLDWDKLYQIVIGVARGLEYLHRGCNTRIVHLDIKPHNILLDQDFCPKISDFGLAKLCHKKDSIISIAGARGTIGYIAPEIFSRNFGVVSTKSDVYSYGMMVLEIAGGRNNENTYIDNSSDVYFPDWIYKHLDKSGSLSSFGVTDESEETVRKLFLVGLWCIQTIPQGRPPMSKVIEMLEGSVDDLQLPPKPYPSSSQCGLWTGNSSIKDICWDDRSSSANS